MYQHKLYRSFGREKIQNSIEIKNTEYHVPSIMTQNSELISNN